MANLNLGQDVANKKSHIVAKPSKLQVLVVTVLLFIWTPLVELWLGVHGYMKRSKWERKGKAIGKIGGGEGLCFSMNCLSSNFPKGTFLFSEYPLPVFRVVRNIC